MAVSMRFAVTQIDDMQIVEIRRSAILAMRLSAIYYFEHSTIDEVHICNKHVRLFDFHNNDYLQVRNVIPTDSSGINYYK